MSTYQKVSLLLLRLGAGWLMLYAGITKVLDPSWTAAGYISSAKNFIWFFKLVSSPFLISITNFVNEWGLTLLGISLILGIFVKYSAPLGALLMLLYYLVLPFPMPNAHAYIIDEHIIYIFVLLVLAASDSGRIWGLDSKR
ncbi:MAG: DoxX family membrane protein [Patescibacteria group bacterium]